MKTGFGKEKIDIVLPAETCWSKNVVEGATTVTRQTDDLFAYVTIWESKGTKGVFITFDAITIPPDFFHNLLEKLIKTGFCGDAVNITATHSHTAPYIIGKQKAAFETACLKAIDKASNDMQDSTLAWGKTQCNINVNRRQIGRIKEINNIDAPSGDVDSDLIVLSFKRERDEIVLINYTGHSITLSGESSLLISADYPGQLIKCLENSFPGMNFQFLQGAAGNINVKIHGGISESEKVGRILADKTSEVLKKLNVVSVPHISAEVKRFKLPFDIQATLKDLENVDITAPGMKKWASEVKNKIASGDVPKFLKTQVNKVSFGSLNMIFMPGEPFAEIGKKLKEINPSTIVIGYSNDNEAGYIPTKEAFNEGGYEPDYSYRFVRIWKYSPNVGEIFFNNCKDLLMTSCN